MHNYHSYAVILPFFEGHYHLFLVTKVNKQSQSSSGHKKGPAVSQRPLTIQIKKKKKNSSNKRAE